MSAGHLDRIVAARSSGAADGTDLSTDPFPLTELQIAAASAVSSGESLAVVAAMADLPALAVLDAVDALQPHGI